MEDYKIILNMIEEVSLDDTAKLDEIDARVYLYVYRQDVKPDQDIDDPIYKKVWQIFSITHKYTRSRDALKAIRPNGWTYKNAYHFEYESERPSEFGFVLRNNPENKIEQYQIVGKAWQNEELAELHAIIQAIAYERENK